MLWEITPGILLVTVATVVIGEDIANHCLRDRGECVDFLGLGHTNTDIM